MVSHAEGGGISTWDDYPFQTDFGIFVVDQANEHACGSCAGHIFVAGLPCSGLIYAEGSWTEGQEDWLSAHVRLFSFIGGVTAKVVPDNLKTGVTHASYWDPVINASYAALIKHYGTVVLPARVSKPRDKPSAESSVLQVYRWLLAPLRTHYGKKVNQRKLAKTAIDKLIGAGNGNKK